jgi:hypothetical protein
MQRLIILLLLSLASVAVIAQKSLLSNISIQPHIGFANNNENTSTLLGLQALKHINNQWELGLGAQYGKQYKTQQFGMFQAIGQYNFTTKGSTVFATAQAGLSIALNPKEQFKYLNSFQTYTGAAPGPSMQLGLGYKFKGAQTGFVITAGYLYQQYTIKSNNEVLTPNPLDPFTVFKDEHKYAFQSGRLFVTLGFML